ncbi:MAG: DUF2007 domain-containing protein [Planctomycetota bacterium]
MDELNLKKIAETESETEAIMFRSVLEEAGIKGILVGLEASALGASIDGNDFIELLVNAEQADEASAIIEELTQDSQQEIPEWTCQCGEQVDAGFAICWACQADYPPDGPGPVDSDAD